MLTATSPTDLQALVLGVRDALCARREITIDLQQFVALLRLTLPSGGAATLQIRHCYGLVLEGTEGDRDQQAYSIGGLCYDERSRIVSVQTYNGVGLNARVLALDLCLMSEGSSVGKAARG